MEGHCDAFAEAAFSPATELGPSIALAFPLVLGGLRPEEQLQATPFQTVSPRVT